jgi:hypothetical protein
MEVSVIYVEIYKTNKGYLKVFNKKIFLISVYFLFNFFIKIGFLFKFIYILV